MSGCRWVITPLWLSGSWSLFLYSSSVYSCYLFLISSASVRSLPFLSFIVPIFAWNVPLVSSIFYWKFYFLTSSRICVFFLYPCSLSLSSGPHPLFSGQVSGVPEPLAPVIHCDSACTQSHPPTIPDMTFPSSVHTDHISGPSIYGFLHLLLPIFFKYWEVVGLFFFFSYLKSNLGVVLVPGQWIGSMATEWERLKISFKKLEIPGEHFIQR